MSAIGVFPIEHRVGDDELVESMDGVAREHDTGRIRPRLALVLGLASLGAEAIDRRLAQWSERAEAEAGARSGLVGPEVRPVRLGTVLLGLAVALPPRATHAAARVRAAVEPNARAMAALVLPVLGLPGVRGVVAYAGRLRARASASLALLASTGERASFHGRCMAEIGAREILEESLAAVGQAAQVREVMVEQSAGLAAEAVDGLRRGAARADDRVEELVRALLPWRRGRASRRPGGAAPSRTADVPSESGSG